jgi:hypothetical protein
VGLNNASAVNCLPEIILASVLLKNGNPIANKGAKTLKGLPSWISVPIVGILLLYPLALFNGEFKKPSPL